MTTSVYFEDAFKLLQFDPAGVVINQVEQCRPLEHIQSFVEKLKRYVELGKAASVHNSRAPLGQTKMAQSIANNENAEALLNFDPAAVVLRQVGKPQILNRLADFATKLQHYLTLASQSERPEAETNNSVVSPEIVLSERTTDVADVQQENATESMDIRPDSVPSQDQAFVSVTPTLTRTGNVEENSGELTTAEHAGEEIQGDRNGSDDVEPAAQFPYEAEDASIEEESTTNVFPDDPSEEEDPQEDTEEEEEDLFLGTEEIQFSTTESARPFEHHDSIEITPNQNTQNGQPQMHCDDTLQTNIQVAEEPTRRSQQVQTLVELHQTTNFHRDVLMSAHGYPHPGAMLAATVTNNIPTPLRGTTTQMDATLLGGPDNISVVGASSTKATDEGNNPVKRDTEVSPDQPLSKRQRRSKKTKKTKKEEKLKEEDLPDLPEAPKVDAPEGYKGSLDESKLERAEGLTREQLNKNLKELGLKAKFAMSVVSCRHGQISHLTFNSAWNELPYTKDQTFKFWMGEGARRLSIATPLDPATNPEQDPVPIFWAQKRSSPALCHYIGHFRCVNFDTTQKVMLKGERRQALLEFKLVEFKNEMEQKLWELKNGGEASPVESAGQIVQPANAAQRTLGLSLWHHSVMA